jgi:hypothetical protein
MITVSNFHLSKMSLTDSPLLLIDNDFADITNMTFQQNTIVNNHGGLIHFDRTPFSIGKSALCTNNIGSLGPCFTANLNGVIPKATILDRLKISTWLLGSYNNNVATIDGGAFVLVFSQNQTLNDYLRKAFTEDYKGLAKISDLSVTENKVGSEARDWSTGNSWDIAFEYVLHPDNINATKNTSDKGIIFFDNLQTAKSVFKNLTIRVSDQFGRKPIPTSLLREGPKFGKAWLFSPDLNISIFVGNNSADSLNIPNGTLPGPKNLRLRARRALQNPTGNGGGPGGNSSAGGPPAGGNGGNPPAGGNGGNPPAGGNGGNPPAGGNGGNPPAGGNSSAGGPPAGGNGGKTPAGGAGNAKPLPPPLAPEILDSLKKSPASGVQKKVNVSGTCYNKWRGGSLLKVSNAALNDATGTLTLIDQPIINSPEGTWFLILDLGISPFSILKQSLASNIFSLEDNAFFVLPLNYVDGHCNCPAGTFLDANDCKKCHDSCLSCNATGAKGCVLCQGGTPAVGGVCSCQDGEILTRDGCLSNF